MFVRLFWFLILFASLSTSALATPISVLVFPTGAIITEEAKIEVTDGGFDLFLPESASPDSIRVSLENSLTKITSINAENVRLDLGDPQNDQANIKSLKIKLEDASLKRSEIQDQISAHQLSLDFYRSLAKSPEQSESVDTSVVEKLITSKPVEIFREISKLRKDVEKTGREIAELKRKIALINGASKRAWKVRATVEGVEKSVIAKYQYRVHSATWKPIYRINAVPTEDLVEWEWLGEISQSTGVDWVDATVSLATSEPNIQLTPPSIRPWNIRLFEVRNQFSARKAAPMMEVAEDAVMSYAASDTAGAPVAPARQEGALFDVYQVGKISINAGDPTRIIIREGTWVADFSYLVRPYFSEQVFLTGNINYKDHTPMPSGEATLLVDDVFIGKRPFSLNADSIQLFFGNDPAVVANIESQKTSDEKWSFGTDKIFDWNWTVELTNNKNRPISVRVEDSLPLVGDKRIEIKEKGLAGWEKDKMKNLHYYLADLSSGETRKVNFGYEIKYPKDLSVHVGR